MTLARDAVGDHAGQAHGTEVAQSLCNRSDGLRHGAHVDDHEHGQIEGAGEIR